MDGKHQKSDDSSSNSALSFYSTPRHTSVIAATWKKKAHLGLFVACIIADHVNTPSPFQCNIEEANY